MDKKVSIIIPIYKTERWLPKCLESCLNQTYNNIEIILIDDGSPDNSGKICDEYAKRDKRIIVLHQQNSGVSSARNNGLNHATGEFIMFVDSDDWLDETAVEKFIALQQTQDFDLIIAGYNRLKQKKALILIPESKAFLKKSDLFKEIINNPDFLVIPPWARLFKRNIIEKYGLRFDINLKSSEDSTFNWSYLEHIQSLSYLNEALYYYQCFTFDKSAHYQIDDAVYQWKLRMIVHGNYKKLFVNTNTYQQFKEEVDSKLIYRIKHYLNIVILHDADRQAVIGQVKTIADSEYYQDLQEISVKNIKDTLEKFVLICCKLKLWNLMYLTFKIKSELYNKRRKET